MTSPAGQDRSHESIINDNLARLFRERLGMDAVAETLHGGRRPDVVARMPGGAPIVLETEIAPAPTVEADALSRLGMEIDGRRVENAFAVTAPGRMRTAPQQSLYEQLAVARLTWREWRSDGTAGPGLEGTFAELGDAVVRAIPPRGNLEEAVDLLEQGARNAGARILASPGTAYRVGRVFGTEPGEESSNMAALVIINAMVFQNRLADVVGSYLPVSATRRYGAVEVEPLLRVWSDILQEDYYPIFSLAEELVMQFASKETSEVLGECAQTADRLLRMGAVGRHDLTGRIFNRLIAERKLLAAFYTSIPASTLLAGLALAPERWTGVQWGELESVGQMRVVDPACGTGTLPMAAYRQIVRNYTTAGRAVPEDPALHRELVERVIIGLDVVKAAIHLTAATLASMSPSARFKQMQLDTLRLGMDDAGKVHLGSLEWLAAPKIQSFFSATEEQMGATNGNGRMVRRPQADLVISNPPYTRRGADGSREESIARVFSIPEGDADSQDAIKKRTAALLKGTGANQIAGHGSSFVVLADLLVNLGGRIALVLPATALAGESWRRIRGMLAERYEIEFVVSSHDPGARSISYDTGIAEILLVARRLEEKEEPARRGIFVNLWRTARQETDALALVQGITATAAAPVLRSDGPPAGGTPLIIGRESWGEVVDGPVGDAPWQTARWRNALTCQLVNALERGEVWNTDGLQVIGRIPIAALGDVCNVGPEDRAIHGPNGVFNAYRGQQEQAPFPALWRHSASVHQKMTAEPNSYLSPRAGRDYQSIWARSGNLHITRDVQYDSQRVMATRTATRTLGVSQWYSLNAPAEDPAVKFRWEIALALWCNSTLGIAPHANHDSRSQVGRGRGSRGMLQSMPVLEVRRLADWQLAAAEGIWRDFQERTFQSFHQCAVDAARIELDERVVRELLGLGEDAVAAVARLRRLLAADPSIHGGKAAELP